MFFDKKKTEIVQASQHPPENGIHRPCIDAHKSWKSYVETLPRRETHTVSDAAGWSPLLWPQKKPLVSIRHCSCRQRTETVPPAPLSRGTAPSH